MQHCVPLWSTALDRIFGIQLLHFFMIRKVVENEDSIVIDATDVFKYIISNISYINDCS